MKLFFSGASPFVRKVSVCAIELGLDGKIERIKGAAHPINRDAAIVATNPLGKVPTLIADDGLALYDSRVICEYLDQVGGGGKLFPRDSSRWRVLIEQAAADGLMDAGILMRYEATVRAEPHRWADWTKGQMEKVHSALDAMQGWAPGFGARVDIGTITTACALGWLDFRFADMGWRNSRPALAAWFEGFEQRPSMQQTKPFA